MEATVLVRLHYSMAGLEARVRGMIDDAGGGSLELEALEPVDQNHVGGIDETRRLARAAGARPGLRVLDVGCALGGAARLLAREFGCSVTGIDLMPEFCTVARFLNGRLRPGPLPSFVCGSSVALPFADASFDLVWSQHATMNVVDKARLFAEMRRVLVPGGRILLHEILAGARQPIHFPVPWAADASISSLVSAETLGATLARTGLRLLSWEDGSRAALDWFMNRARRRSSGFPTGIDLVFGPVGSHIKRNLVRNLLEKRMVIAEIKLTPA